jgi:hypothetical protein
MSTYVRRPFGVSLITILLYIGGVLDITGGIILLIHGGDDNILSAADVTSGTARAWGVTGIILGVIVIVVGALLSRGSNFARYLIAIIAAFRLFMLIWALIAFHSVYWYNAFWPLLIYAVIAGYLLLDKDAQAFFDDNR